MCEFRRLKLLEGHRAVVVGAGKSGQAAGRLLLTLGAAVRFVDADTSLDDSFIAKLGVNGNSERAELQTGPHTPEQFAGADIVVLSPGVPVRKMAKSLAEVPSRKIVAEVELASWFLESPVLAITGTNGKTTTTTLVSEILKAAGKSVFTGGNIGTPLCDHLLDENPADVVVLEVSSFQLQNCRLFKPRVGVLLNFAPNHLDYHEDMEEYLEAKLNLFARMESGDTVILPESMRPMLESRRFTEAERVWFAPTEDFPCPGLPGEHNRANIAAAWEAVQRFGVTRDEAAKAIATFSSLPHRIQTVEEIGGVRFVDDSKATTLDAVEAAVKSFDAPVRLLMGGVFKGGDVASLAEAVQGRVAQVALFGASRDVFEQPLAKHFPVTWDETLEQATRRLAADAAPGDVILLSPATSSFDQYTSYAQRGDDFQRVVRQLKEQRA